MRNLLSVLCIILLVSCASTPPPLGVPPSDAHHLPLKERLRGPVVGGHQGDLFSLKFNTLAAFEMARRADVDIVEMDLRLSGDGVPMVYHDSHLSRWTTCAEHLRALLASGLKNCRMKYSEEYIPTFEEVLLWSHGRVILNVEWKDAETIAPAIRLVHQYGAREWVYFQATSVEQYRIARTIDKNIAMLRAPHDMEELKEILAEQDPHIVIIELHSEIRTPEVIRSIHTAGKLTSENSWHFSLLHELFGARCTSLFRAGIDIAITNRPASCVKQKMRVTRERAKTDE